MFICLNNMLLIFVRGNFSFVCKSFINGICVVVLALAVMTISGATFHPLDVKLLLSG